MIIKKKKKGVIKDGFDLDKASMPRRFSYNGLVVATNRFANDRRLGEEGYAPIYKGFLSDLGCVVAMKRIFSDVEDSKEILMNEVNIISPLIRKK